MTQSIANMPFHAGELEAQARAGVGDVALWADGFIRDYMPAQHRNFHTSLPFLIISGADADRQTWVTLIDGAEGFISSSDVRSLVLDTHIDHQDPLATAFNAGTDIGVIGIELASRRRNRLSGHMRQTSSGFAIDIRQTFGNCPQYIHERIWTRVPQSTPVVAQHGTGLSSEQINWIRHADTMFIGSGHQKGEDTPSRGFDASHRAGAPGFVNVPNPGQLCIPDYAGNNFFNTIGNLITNPRIGLLFVDFDTGSLLHITGRASIDWHPKHSHDPDAWRMINVDIDAVIERPNAVALRWSKRDHLSRQFKVTRRIKEARSITSFYLTPLGKRPLPEFKAGQHLPVEIHIPGQAGPTKRSYSLSSAPNTPDHYRLSIKRENKGLVSRFFHDAVIEGSIIRASNPSGNFVIPNADAPLVLVSAGVGLTPMVSMLHAALSDDNMRPVWFIHGTKNGSEHALRGEVDQLVAKHPNARQQIFYSRPEDNDAKGVDYHTSGRITAQVLTMLRAGTDAHYMLCGPVRFLSDIRNGLEAAGVPAENIQLEAFGPMG